MVVLAPGKRPTRFSPMRYGQGTAGPHAITSATTNDGLGERTYTYDAAGNMTYEWTGSTVRHQYFYDADGRTWLRTNPGAYAGYFYDADGNLIRKLENGDVNGTVYIGGIFEKDVDSGISKKYYFADGKRIAMRIDSSSTVYHLAQDHLGSTSVTQHASIAISFQRHRYYPFGLSRQGGGGVTDKFFTGQQKETASGIYHYGARLYNAEIGRFISPDSIVQEAGNPQVLNRYSYVVNNPMRYIDPTGNCFGEAPVACDGLTQEEVDVIGEEMCGCYSETVSSPMEVFEYLDEHDHTYEEAACTAWSPICDGLWGDDLYNFFLYRGLSQYEAACATFGTWSDGCNGPYTWPSEGTPDQPGRSEGDGFIQPSCSLKAQMRGCSYTVHQREGGTEWLGDAAGALTSDCAQGVVATGGLILISAVSVTGAGAALRSGQILSSATAGAAGIGVANTLGMTPAETLGLYADLGDAAYSGWQAC